MADVKVREPDPFAVGVVVGFVAGFLTSLLGVALSVPVTYWIAH